MSKSHVACFLNLVELILKRLSALSQLLSKLMSCEAGLQLSWLHIGVQVLSLSV